MKGSQKIITHYLLLVGCISLLLLAINLGVLTAWAFSAGSSGHYQDRISSISQGLTKTEGRFSLSSEMADLIDDHYAFAMLLNEEGQVIWSYHLPDSIPLDYTASDIATFSKWYLQDYPVQSWSTENGLFVLAEFPHTTWKKLFFFPEQSLRNAPAFLLGGLILNFIFAILLALLFGLRFMRSLQEVMKGIEDLGNKKAVHLSSKGLFHELAAHINTVSGELVHKQELIDKRDTARNNWIAGVSHDIRTPLSMIMGYSSNLEANPTFSEEDRHKLSIIRMQSERISSLVNDLNLTVKLEYEMQPLRMAPFYPPQLLRKVVVYYLNHFTDDHFSIELNISESCQHYQLVGDQSLFERALHNIIGNSLRHNEKGCHLTITLNEQADGYHLDLCDNGSGFETATLEKLNTTSELPVGATHGLGLFIVKQIVHVHGGKVTFGNLMAAPSVEPLGSHIGIVLPLE